MTEPTRLMDTLNEIDQRTFDGLVVSHRRELLVHCYRMLGSTQEAEEMVQEVFWRAWDRRETYQGRSTLRAWLYKIATNQCIDALRKRPRRVLPISLEAASTSDQPIRPSVQEPVWLEPFPDELLGVEDESPESKYSRNESIRLAFLISLHLLPPRQRAALILRDVLGWQTDEVAEALAQTVPSIKSALHRARTTLAQNQAALQPENIPVRVSDEALRRQLDRYVSSWEQADVDGLVALLKEEATFSMPPIPNWYCGRENIRVLVKKTIFAGEALGRWRLVPTRANGQPGFGLYRLEERAGIYAGYGIQVVTLDGELIRDITTFRNPALIPYFKLPTILQR